jgi:hypothetical protein
VSTQTLGLALLALGFSLLFHTAWPVVAAGVLLLVVPEVLAAIRRAQAEVDVARRGER